MAHFVNMQSRTVSRKEPPQSPDRPISGYSVTANTPRDLARREESSQRWRPAAVAALSQSVGSPSAPRDLTGWELGQKGGAGQPTPLMIVQNYAFVLLLLLNQDFGLALAGSRSRYRVPWLEIGA